MKIFVTGATGFLGRHLCATLTAQQHDVVGVSSKSCDLTQHGSLEAFSKEKFDRIYHLAAWTQAGNFCSTHSGEQWLINQKIHTNLLCWWKENQPQALLVAPGTSVSYDPAFPLTEENYLRGEPVKAFFSYAMTKRMLLSGLMALHQQYGLNYLYFVPSTLYGVNYHTDGRQMHFIFDLIRKISNGKYFQAPVVLFGDGEQKRELIHVQDCINALLLLNEKGIKNCVINLGGGKEYRIKDFAQTISSYLGYPFDKIQFDETQYVGARSKLLSIEKMRTFLPEFSSTPLSEGLIETIEWFKKVIV